MLSAKKLLLWGLCLVVLSVALVLIEKRKEALDAQTQSEKKLFNLKGSDISGLSVKGALESWSIKQDAQKHWHMTHPKPYEIDSGQVQEFVRAFESIDAQESLDATNLEAFGLDVEDSVYTAFVKEKAFSVYKGNRTPDGNTVYVKTNQSQKIYVVAQSHFESHALGKSLDSIREKDILKIKDDQIQELTLNTLRFVKTDVVFQTLPTLPKGVLLPKELQQKLRYLPDKHLLSFQGKMTTQEKQSCLKLSQDEAYQKAIKELFLDSQSLHWTLPSQEAADVDMNKADQLISNVSSIRVSQFLDEAQQKRVSFTKALSVEIKTSSAHVELRLTRENNKTYMLLKSKNQVYEISEYVYNQLNHDVAYFLRM